MVLIIDYYTMMNSVVVQKLREVIEEEARSCTMDFGCITPLYVYRMWGGRVPLDDITPAFQSIKVSYGY